VATPNPASPADSPARRDWLDVTIRLATSWVGLFTAYVVALILAIGKFNELKDGLEKMHLPPWAGIALIAAFPVLALTFSTIPAFIEQRRIKRYSEIKGSIETGYFTLRPRDNEETFERADNAHQEILRWIRNSCEPVLYLTGASGTGKSSLLSAWVIPRLQRENHVVLQLRGYEDVLVRLKEELLEPGAVWAKPPGKIDDLRLLLDRAKDHLAERRLLIVVDQFEEFLILSDQERQQAFQKFLSGSGVEGVTILLVYRPEYEGLIQDQPWPKMQLDTNRKVISPFTENVAQEFLRKSGLAVNADLMRAVLREAAEIEQTTGLIRPVTINMCGLVLSRFSSGLPRKFRGGLIRGFLKESLSLPEVRDPAEKLIPQLITGNVTKHPRRIDDLVAATGLPLSAVRACLRRLGESDRAVLRPLDQPQETWEISHDFLVPLLDAIVARRTLSLWRRFRPWLPWAAAAVLGIAAVAIPLLPRQDPTVALRKQGWSVSEEKGTLALDSEDNVPSESIPILRGLAAPFSLYLGYPTVTDVSALRELKNLKTLDLHTSQVTDLSPLGGLKNLTALNLEGVLATDLSALRGLKNLTELNLNSTRATDLSPLRELKNLTVLRLSNTAVADLSPLEHLTNLALLDLGNSTRVVDLSPLRGLTNLTELNLLGVEVADVSALRELKKLTWLNLNSARLTDVSALAELKSLKMLFLNSTGMKDASALRGLKNLTTLNLGSTKLTDASALGELKNLTILSLNSTGVTDASALRELKNLTALDLSNSKITGVSPLGGLTNLTTLYLVGLGVTDLSPLRGLKKVTDLNIGFTGVTDVSALRDLQNLITLKLNCTGVSDLSPIGELKNLATLDLSGPIQFTGPGFVPNSKILVTNSQVTDVSALRELENLKTLNLSNTKVTDVSPLRELKNLTELNLSGTKVADVSSLRDLKNLKTLYIIGTKVTDVSAFRDLKFLNIIGLPNR
jgi:Leucine-rich repeat (LRR) protein